MKLDRRRATPVLFALLALFAHSTAALPDALVAGSNLQANGATTPDPDAVVAAAKSGPLGTEHAPVDGKDGMPHEGPFVETSAQRSRKKMLESGDDDDVPDAPRKISQSYKEQFTDGDLPQSNDGVMDAPGRLGPADGTRGVEGGVSGKNKDKTAGGPERGKVPETPKEIPPLPYSEKEKMKGSEALNDDVPDTIEDDGVKKLLDKPNDLPAKPHDIPLPANPSSPKHDATFADASPHWKQDSASTTTPEKESAVIQPLHSLLLSFTMILFSEVGDKTFLIAALMAMRHDRIVVFTAAFSALITMTVLSAVLGHAVPTLIPKSITNFAAAGLFLVFGVKMLLEARKISPDEGVTAEMKEVEMELEEKEHAQRMGRRRSSISPYVLESGLRKARAAGNGRLPSPPESPFSSSSRDASPSRSSSIRKAMAGINNLLSLLLSPAWVQTFVMTFLGEWGDRSQIATIAMAAGQDYWWVTGGALCGHAICTGAAVLGGKAIAGKVSLRTVTMGGAIAFLVFGVIYLIEAVY